LDPHFGPPSDTPGQTGSLQGSPVSLSYQDTNLRIVWIVNPPKVLGNQAVPGQIDSEILPESAATISMLAKREAISSGSSRRVEVLVDAEEGARRLDLYIAPDRNASGVVTGLYCTTIDVTEQRRLEATQRTLLRELSHRSKNLLAIVQSLASQTARTSGSIGGFLERFNGRLQAISRSQDLVTAADWRGASLSELVTTQVEPYVADAATQLDLGLVTDYTLSPNAALHVGLALHELSVNSVQNGAFASPIGKVTLSTRRIDEPGVEAGKGGLRIHWTEPGGFARSREKARDFGQVLLARVVPAAVGGSAELTVSGGTLSYELTLARVEFE
jgi:two-component sensor histidine kinase